jgi:D-3-phosphoglycerate dehydrogenase
VAAVVRRTDPMTPAPPGEPVPGGPPAAGRPLVVITDCDHPGIETERAILAAAGLEVRQARCRTPEDVLAAGQDAVALLVQYAPVTAEVLAGLPACQVVARYGTGLDSIDVAAARARAVEVISVPDYSVQEVSDHALALVLTLCRRVAAAAAAVRAGRWDLADAAGVRRLSALRLGVVGLGRIGQAVAAKASALGFDVVGCDVAPPARPVVPLLSLDELLATSDVVTLHVPLSARTRHLIGESALARMRPEAVLVNTSRGALVDQPALRRALAAGRLAGAGLDVLEAEPPDPDDPLLHDERVIVTPHIAFYSAESLAELKRRVAEGIVAALGRRGIMLSL